RAGCELLHWLRGQLGPVRGRQRRITSGEAVGLVGLQCRSWTSFVNFAPVCLSMDGARSLPSGRYAEFGTLEGNEASWTCRFVATRHQRAITLPVMPAPDYVEPLTDSALRRGALAVVPVRRARGGGLRRFARNRS